MENNNGIGGNHALPLSSCMAPDNSGVYWRYDKSYWKTKSNINAPTVSSAHT